MHPELTRAHRRYLGLHAPLPERLLDPRISDVKLDPAAANFIRAQLNVPGPTRCGPLYGLISRAMTLHVAFAASGGYPGLAGRTDDPLRLDGSYLLGYMDALRASHPEPLDWVGLWMVAGHQQLPDAAEVESLMLRAAHDHLAGDGVVLVTMGGPITAPQIGGYQLYAAREVLSLQVSTYADAPATRLEEQGIEPR